MARKSSYRVIPQFIISKLLQQNRSFGNLFIEARKVATLVGETPRTIADWGRGRNLPAYRYRRETFYHYRDFERQLFSMFGQRPDKWLSIHASIYDDPNAYFGKSEAEKLNFVRKKLFPSLWVRTPDPFENNVICSGV